ncbi:MAG: hypothetical protein ACI9Y7_001689 [Dokdonia sp.]|jgi:hypothetical protein
MTNQKQFIMKFIFYICFFAFSLAFYGCSPENDTIPETEIPEEASQENLTLVIEQVKRLAIGVDCPPRIIDFNTDGQITEINSCGSPLRTFFRDSEGLITGITSVGSFGYDNGIWTSYSTANDTGGSTITITYDGNIMAFHSTFNGQMSPNRNEFVFEDDTYKKILSIRSVDNSTGEVLYEHTTFTYSGNNISTINQKTVDPVTNELIPFVDHSFTYDDKINPYKMGLPTNAGFSAYTPFLFWDGVAGIVWLAEHNVTERVYTHHVNGFTTTQVYEYEYNEDDYPIQMEESIGGELRYTQSFEYY